MTSLLRIGVLISSSGTNLDAIITACNKKEISGGVVVVGSDRASAAGLEKAQRAGSDTFVVDYKRYLSSSSSSTPNPSVIPKGVEIEKIMAFFEETEATTRGRLSAEIELLSHLQKYELDLLVLAGFMRQLTPYFITSFSPSDRLPKIMNIHPSLLPAFPGTDGYGDAFRYGCKVAGCTVHFVNEGLDAGPIIAQAAFPMEEADTLKEVRQKGLQKEWALYPHCIELYAQQRLTIKNNRVCIQ